jgi:hypothetical protein
MSRRAAFWLAWFTWVLYLVIAVVTLLLQMKNGPPALFTDIFNALVLLAFATVGTLIASQRPQNPIGWIFCTSTLLWALGNFLQEYAVYALFTAPGLLPAGALLGVFGEWAGGMGWFLMLTFLLLLFPNGHLPSPRWRPLARLIAGLLVVYTIVNLLAPTNPNQSNGRLATVLNPIGIAGASDLFNVLTAVIPLVLFATIIPCIVAVVLRFRRARGIERQQLKWFTYGMTVSILMLSTIIILVFANVNGASSTFFYLAVACIPISAGIAMLRYRLYDIDVLINRTLIYGILTAVLALAYFTSILILQYLLSSFTHGSQIPIVGSTLFIAVLFQPLRGRIQRIIDRRFYRSKYDAARTLADFGARLRSEVDLQQLSEHLLAVVQETMQPTHVSLWLRPYEHDAKQPASWKTTTPVSSKGG